MTLSIILAILASLASAALDLIHRHRQVSIQHHIFLTGWSSLSQRIAPACLHVLVASNFVREVTLHTYLEVK